MATLTTFGDATSYTTRGSPGIGFLNTGGWDNIYLTSLNASLHVSFHENLLDFFISLKIGFILSASLGLHLNNDVNLPTNHWISFRLFEFLMVSRLDIYPGLLQFVD